MTGVITPSSKWQGTLVPGSRWTAQQLELLKRERCDPQTVRTATIARMPRVNAENWTLPPVAVRIDLPCLAVARNGRVKVITPAGSVDWMEPADG